MDSILNEIQTVLTSLAAAAVTALCVYGMNWLRDILGIKESDSNEQEIRNAAVTEAGKLVVQGKLDDPQAIISAASKVMADLHQPIRDEGYEITDIKDMIIGAAATIFPPAGLLKILK